MVKRLIVPIFFVFGLLPVFSQVGPIEKLKLAELLVERINTHRQENGMLPLKRDASLAKAADIQSNYLLKAKKLKHTHPEKKYREPFDRVMQFSSVFETVGENVLVTKPLRFPLSKGGWNKIAYDMFRSWKASRGHYKNMMSSEYSHADFAFDYDAKSKRIYAVHVFGKMGVRVEGQLSENAFGLEPMDTYCNELIAGNRNIIVNMGNSLTIEDNRVVLRYHSLDRLKELLDHKLDGLAVDLVQRDQMLCGQDNKLDASTIYDGVLLPPVFREELLANNTAQNPKRVVVSLGEIPQALRNKELSPNLITIQLGAQCSYSTPASVDSRRYDLRPVAPKVYDPKVTLSTHGIGQVDEVYFEFETGKQIAKAVSGLRGDNLKTVKAVDIKSYTSVDGSPEINQLLHKKRGEYIHETIDRIFNLKNAQISNDSKENWELCDYQLEVFGEEDVRQWERKKIRNYINAQNSARWSKALSEQRKSKATIYFEDTWDKENEDHFYFNLVNGLVSKDYEQANQALFEIYHDTINPYFLGEDFIIDRMFNKKELVQNVSALLLRDIYGYSLDNVVYFVRTWLSRADELSVDAQKNLLNLYTITGRRMLRRWDVSAENLAKVMHPDKVNPLFDYYKSSDIVNPLFLNFHMTRIEYFGQINQQREISESFRFITNYFREEALTVEDDINLSLFFNSWSMYHLTIEELLERLWEDDLNKRASFILAQTLTAYPYARNGTDIEASQLLSAHKKAIAFDQSLWCEWINKEFQNLRRPGLKTLYCKTCKP